MIGILQPGGSDPMVMFRYNRAIMSPQEPVYAVIAYEGINPFLLSVPCVIFGSAPPALEVMVCATDPTPLRSSAGFSIHTTHTLDDLHGAHTVIVPSWRDTKESPPEHLLTALRDAHERGARIVGLCLGSFVLAAAGLLDGRRATTHWKWADELARTYPRVDVDPDILYVDDGDIVTSAGSAAAIDCCLHLLRMGYGAEIANQVARRMVVSPFRQGGQAQFIEQPEFRAATPDRLSSVMDWMVQNLGTRHSLDALAERALMSRRTFTRVFRQRTGTTVGKWLLHQRLAMAQRLLETTGKPIERVAELSGFLSPSLFRRSFVQEVGVKPSAYRQSFRGD